MKKLILMLVLFALLGGCTRKKENFIGPDICPTDAFTQTGISHAATVNLATTTFTIKDTLSEVVDWEVTIKGNTSGSVKRFKDRSKLINLVWYGEPDTALFFKVETCTVTLKIACLASTATSFDITTVSNFSNAPNMLLVANFDGAGVSQTWGGYGGTDVTYNAVSTSPSDPSPQGGNYWKVVGDTVGGGASYYFGGCYSGPPFLLSSAKSTWTDPSQIYVNFFASTENGLTNSEIQFLGLPKGLGQVYRKQITWSGWKLLSYKLSDYEFVQPGNITSFDVGLGSAPNKGFKATMKIDFVILTYGKPFYEEK